MLYSTAVKNPPPKITYRRKLVTTQQASKSSSSKNSNNLKSSTAPTDTGHPYAQWSRKNIKNNNKALLNIDLTINRKQTMNLIQLKYTVREWVNNESGVG